MLITTGHSTRANNIPPSLQIIVRGSGDIGSAIAVRLFKAGYAVILQDVRQPAVTRRKMAFSDALFDGTAELEGVQARRITKRATLAGALAAHTFLPITSIRLELLIEHLHPQVLVDARMRKHSQPENQISLAALTIGLGPNFIAGQTVHLAVETSRGQNLGQIIPQGSTQPLSGEPISLEGHARDRYVYAPHAARFHTWHQIGDKVEQGQQIAQIGETPIFAPISGSLRGLTRNGVQVELKTKIIEIDPRAENAQVSGIAERPARIAQSVCMAIDDWQEKQAH